MGRGSRVRIALHVAAVHFQDGCHATNLVADLRLLV
jgi:hypothetical protein